MEDLKQSLIHAFDLLIDEICQLENNCYELPELIKNQFLIISKESQLMAYNQGIIASKDPRPKHILELKYIRPFGPLALIPSLMLTEKSYQSLASRTNRDGSPVVLTGLKKTSEPNDPINAFVLINLELKEAKVIWTFQYSSIYKQKIYRHINKGEGFQFGGICLNASGSPRKLKATTAQAIEEANKDFGSIRKKIERLRKQNKLPLYRNNCIELATLPTINLGHQIWNQFSGAALATSWIRSYQPEQDINILIDPITNYFPVEAVALGLDTQFSHFKFDREQTYISNNYLYYSDSKKPLYRIAQKLVKTYIQTKKSNTNSRITRKDAKKTQQIIFSLKSGNKSFSATQFDIEDALKITSQTIKELNQESPGHYHFIIDGITSPYIAEEQQGLQGEPEQRKCFRESEEHWFGKLREELPSIELTFINGMNLVEKYPYYQAASKFIRFGDGSFQLLWYALRESNTSNQLGVMYQQGEKKRKIELRNLASGNWKCLFYNESNSHTIENIKKWIQQ